MSTITPFLWFDDNAEDAMKHYTSIFPDSKVLTESYYPEGAPGKAGSLMTATFELLGQQFSVLNGGPFHAQFNEAISFFVLVETQEELDSYWSQLLEGGEPSQCGWLKDKFGLSWQIVPTVLGQYLSDPDPLKAQNVMQAMMQMVKLDIDTLTKAYNQ